MQHFLTYFQDSQNIFINKNYNEIVHNCDDWDQTTHIIYINTPKIKTKIFKSIKRTVIASPKYCIINDTRFLDNMRIFFPKRKR